MPRGKAQFYGKMEPTRKAVSKELQEALRDLCPLVPETAEEAEARVAFHQGWRGARLDRMTCNQQEEVPWDPRDQFVEEVLQEADSVADRLDSLRQSSTKADLGAELGNIKKRAKSLKSALKALATVNGLRADLQGLSTDVLILLGPEPIDLDCADVLGQLEMPVESAIKEIDTLLEALKAVTPKKIEEHCRRKANKRTYEHYLMVEAAIRVLRVAKKHGMPIAATCDVENGYMSDAVNLLSLIGPIMGLNNSGYTWRDIVGDARQKAIDLQ